MRILICGATGFIGRNTAEWLAKNTDHEIIGVYHNKPPFESSKISWREADLTNADDVERITADIDVIIQAAATTSGSKDIVSRPHIHVTDNAVMNSLLFRSAHDHNIKHVIFFSCSIMYQNSTAPLKETDFDAGQDMDERYFAAGWTKVYLEKQCEFFAGLGSTKFTVLRHSNIYGPHDKFDHERSHVFGATITKVMTANTGSISVWGTGEEGRDLLYIDDLVKMISLSLDNQKQSFGLYNVGSGKIVTIKDLVHKIVAASGQNLNIEHDLSQPTIPTTVCLDCSKAKKEIGWEPEISIDTGIKRTLAWWQDNIGSIT